MQDRYHRIHRNGRLHTLNSSHCGDQANGTFINIMHAILTFRHLTFTKSLLLYKYTHNFKLYFIHTQQLWQEKQVPESTQHTKASGPSPDSTSLPLPSPASHLSPSSACRAAGVCHWLARIFGLVITCQPGSLDPRDSTCTNQNQTFYIFQFSGVLELPH